MNSKQAKQIPIEIYLDRLGYKPKVVKKNEIWYISPLRGEKTASFKVNRILNTWYDFGGGEGGSIIDLVILQFQTDVSGALKRLESAFWWGKLVTLCRPDFQRSSHKEDSREITAIKSLSSSSLISYLRERKVNITTAKKYLSEIHYKSGERSYLALCFKNDSWGYETRSRFFKGSFSPKDITTIRGNKESKNILIFEWFIDFISYLSYKQKSCLNENIIVLNSTSLAWKAIERIRELKPVELHFYLDNDNAWERAKEIILKETGINGFSKNLYYAGFKDVNDFIRGIKQK